VDPRAVLVGLLLALWGEVFSPSPLRVLCLDTQRNAAPPSGSALRLAGGDLSHEQLRFEDDPLRLLVPLLVGCRSRRD